MRCPDFFLMTRCRVTRQKYVPTFIRWWVPPLAPLSYSTHQPIPHPHPLTYNYHPWPPTPTPTHHIPPNNLYPPTHRHTQHPTGPTPCTITYILSPVSSLWSPVSCPVSSLPSLVSHLQREGRGWPPEWVEDDRCAGRGEFGLQKGWRMTAGRRGESLTTSRMGRR